HVVFHWSSEGRPVPARASSTELQHERNRYVGSPVARPRGAPGKHPDDRERAPPTLPQERDGHMQSFSGWRRQVDRAGGRSIWRSSCCASSATAASSPAGGTRRGSFAEGAFRAALLTS